MRTSAPPLLPIFRSDLQARLLAVLLEGGQEALTTRTLRERTAGSPAAVHRELRRLVRAGMVEEDAVGRAKLFRAATDAPTYSALRELVERTVGVEAALRRAIAQVDGVRFAAVHGSWARGETTPTSDIDVLVVADADPDDVATAMAGAERLAGRDVNVTTYAPEEFARRRHGGFLRTVLARPTTVLAGRLEDV
jgi:predicted nucleotidyltransferase